MMQPRLKYQDNLSILCWNTTKLAQMTIISQFKNEMQGIITFST